MSLVKNAEMQQSEVKLARRKKHGSCKVYNSKWEEDYILKTWISPCENDRSKVICRFCNRAIRAHKNDLVEHTKTAKHQRNYKDNVSDEEWGRFSKELEKVSQPPSKRKQLSRSRCKPTILEAIEKYRSSRNSTISVTTTTETANTTTSITSPTTSTPVTIMHTTEMSRNSTVMVENCHCALTDSVPSPGACVSSNVLSDVFETGGGEKRYGAQAGEESWGAQSGEERWGGQAREKGYGAQAGKESWGAAEGEEFNASTEGSPGDLVSVILEEPIPVSSVPTSANLVTTLRNGDMIYQPKSQIYQPINGMIVTDLSVLPNMNYTFVDGTTLASCEGEVSASGHGHNTIALVDATNTVESLTGSILLEPKKHDRLPVESIIGSLQEGAFSTSELCAIAQAALHRIENENSAPNSYNAVTSMVMVSNGGNGTLSLPPVTIQ